MQTFSQQSRSSVKNTFASDHVEWLFYPLDGTVQKNAFDCGIPKLDQYLKQYARQNQKKGIAQTIVAVPRHGDRIVAGYYSVSMSQVEHQSLPEIQRKGLPRYPIPAMLIGQLAVDRSMQGRGLGAELLVDAFQRAIRLSAEVGIFAVRVDAVNEQAKKFYLKYGFIAFQDQPFSLFLPLTVVLNAFSRADN